MYTTLELLEAYKARFALVSDYAAAKKLGVSKQCVSKWRGGHTMSEEQALTIAEETGLNPTLAVLGVIAERCGESRVSEFLQRMKDHAAA